MGRAAEVRAHAWDASGRGPRLVNWTAHPTFMSESDMLFSGDWPGHLQRTVEALAGQKIMAMYYNGAEGDQSPVPPAETTFFAVAGLPTELVYPSFPLEKKSRKSGWFHMNWSAAIDSRSSRLAV